MKLIPAGVTRSVARAVLQTKKNSPHIFFVGGVVGIVGSTVLACRSTLKLPTTLDEIEKDVIETKSKHTDMTEDSERYHDLAPVYIRSALKVGKLYAPSIILGSASIAALTGSHVQLSRRNSALTATLALVSKAYDDYRVCVQQEIGEKRELELYHCMEDVELAKDGEASKLVGAVVNPTKHSIYARIFDESSIHWQKNAEMNRIFIQVQQSYFNDRLQVYGHVFLNEVYDHLGFDRTPQGAIVGWVRNSENGDGYIDFGMYDAENSLFVNGMERSIVLDFNVDGIIYNLI